MAALTIAALLTEYGITPAENYAGEVTGDDYILAVDCSEAGASTTPMPRFSFITRSIP